MMEDKHEQVTPEREQVEGPGPEPQTQGEPAVAQKTKATAGAAEEHEEQPETAAAVPEGEVGWQSLLEMAEREGAEPEDPVVQLVHEYKEAIKARDEWEDKYLRAAADFANAKRRAEMRAESQIWAERERLLSSILPVLDDFDRAFRAVPDEEQESSWVEGFALIQRKLQSILEREGVSEIPADSGRPFDPNLHQAVATESADGVESGTILEVLQKGYQVGDRVLRPSMVKVAQ